MTASCASCAAQVQRDRLALWFGRNRLHPGRSKAVFGCLACHLPVGASDPARDARPQSDCVVQVCVYVYMCVCVCMCVCVDVPVISLWEHPTLHVMRDLKANVVCRCVYVCPCACHLPVGASDPARDAQSQSHCVVQVCVCMCVLCMCVC